MSTIIATTLSNGSVSVPTATVVNGSAKAWVNLNGTGTIAARDSFNVASLTDIGAGIYGITFSAAFAAGNYACVSSSGQRGGVTLDVTVSLSDLLAGSLTVIAVAAGSTFDSEVVTASMAGDLA
jgi:hypothetical protein